MENGTLDHQVEVEYGLTLREEKDVSTFGSEKSRYFAILETYHGTLMPVPQKRFSKSVESFGEGNNPILPSELRVELTKEGYQSLLQQRGKGCAFATVRIQLYTRSEEEKK